MKDYELTVLFHPDLEMNLDPALDKVRKIITSSKGEILKEDAEGKRRLAYKIGEHEFAVYHYMDVRLPADAPRKITSVLNITDEVLRHMLVTVDPRKAKMAALRNDEEATDAEAKESAEEESAESSDK